MIAQSTKPIIPFTTGCVNKAVNVLIAKSKSVRSKTAKAITQMLEKVNPGVKNAVIPKTTIAVSNLPTNCGTLFLFDHQRLDTL